MANVSCSLTNTLFSSVSTRDMTPSEKTHGLLNEFTLLLKLLCGKWWHTHSERERRKSAYWKTNLLNEQFAENQIVSIHFVSYYQ